MLKLIHVNNDHQSIIELLPWYVNRTLSTDEHNLVEKHISQCPSCQQEIEFIQTTLEAANDFDASIIPTDDKFNAIMQRIETVGDEQPESNESLPQNAVPLRWFQKPQMAIAASFLGAMLMLYWSSSYFPDKSANIQVLTSADPNTIELRVIFQNSTGQDEAQNILNNADSRLSLRNTHPAYTVTLPDDYDVLKINELIKNLNSNPRVTDVNIERDNN